MNCPSGTDFDEDNYEKLMDGLEFQEVRYSDLEYSGRIDAEYYQKIHLEYESIVRNCKNDKLSNLADFLIGPFGSAYDTGNYTEIPDFRYVRGQDVKSFILNDAEPRYMTEADFSRLSKYALKTDDILVSVVGTLGNACLVREKDIPAIFSCKSTVIRSKAINPYFLTCYLNSKYGKNLLLRKERGAIQKGLNLDDLKVLDIPLFTDKFQNTCENYINEARALLDESNLIYMETEKVLLETLGLKQLEPKNDKFSIKSFKDSFTQSGRIDAEYYQTNYKDYDNLIKQYYNGYGLIGDICTIKDKNYIPDNKIKYSYIELANVGWQGNISDCDKIYGIDLPTRARRIVSTNDVIISSVEGSLSKCALITSDYNGYICTNGFYVINCDFINSETLMFLFKSKPIQALMKRGCSGTILSAIGKDELSKIPLPIIDREVQKKVKKLVTESKITWKRGKELLNTAVKFVEYAIEQGEEIALAMYDVDIKIKDK